MSQFHKIKILRNKKNCIILSFCINRLPKFLRKEVKSDIILIFNSFYIKSFKCEFDLEVFGSFSEQILVLADHLDIAEKTGLAVFTRDVIEIYISELLDHDRLSQVRSEFVSVYFFNPRNIVEISQLFRKFIDCFQDFFQMFYVLIVESFSLIQNQSVHTCEEIVVSSHFVVSFLTCYRSQTQRRGFEKLGKELTYYDVAFVELFIELYSSFSH